LRRGKVVNTWTIDIADGQIQTIRAVLNPDELARVGPVADAWAVVREGCRLGGSPIDRCRVAENEALLKDRIDCALAILTLLRTRPTFRTRRSAIPRR
jgi:hypothetical protein